MATSWNHICSQTLSQIEPKLGGRHWGHMEIKNCKNNSVPISKMATMSAILKIFKQYLLWPSWKSSIVFCSWTVSQIEWKWWKASGHHGDLELLKWFRSDIQDGHHGSHLEKSSNHICNWTVSLIELKHDGSHWGVMEIQNCLSPSIPMSKMAGILKFFKPHLLPNSKSG